MIFFFDRPYDRAKARRMVDTAPNDCVCEVRKKRRSDEQNDKLHAMIDDIRTQVDGADQWSKEDWKLRFMNALRNEVRFLPELDGCGMFPVGQKTSALNVEQFSALIELIHEWGARHGVKWSEPQSEAA